MIKFNTPEILRSRWFLVVSLIIIGYSFFVLGKMVYQNYQVNQQIATLQQEVDQIDQENQKLSDLISYFQTSTYKQQEAREKLGLVLPGEKVLVFPKEEGASNDNIISTATKSSQEAEKVSNFTKWWNLFFAEK